MMRVQPGDDRGSLAFAMLVTLVGFALAAIMVPTALTQITSTREDNRRLTDLSAAQTGLDIALSHIQAANDGTGNGVLATLPCGPFTGTLSTATTANYNVTITYYQNDPRGHENDPTWQAANPPITCINGGGARVTPKYALLRSLGTDQTTTDITKTPNRGLTATYAFHITNENIPGGNIRVYKLPTSKDLCLDAGSSSPLAGTNVQMQPCVEGRGQQKWAYNQDLTITLVGSGMCLEAGSPEAKGNVVKLQKCASPVAVRQRWSANNHANFEGTSDNKTLNGLCFNVQTPDTPGSFVILGDNASKLCQQPHDNIQSFFPEPSAGAGAAGPATGQLVDFAQFGRCLDVTGGHVPVVATYLIAWPCKQAPDPTTIAWNEVWNVPTVPATATKVTGPILDYPGGATYCLKSPNSTAVGMYPIIVACNSSSPTADEVWTVYGDTGDYTSSYRIVDKNGYCLMPSDPNGPNPDLLPNSDQISRIVMATCDGSTLQKWNAPPDLLESSQLSNMREN